MYPLDCSGGQLYVRDADGNFVRLMGVNEIHTEIEDKKYDYDCFDPVWNTQMSFTIKLTHRSERRLRKTIIHDVNAFNRAKRTAARQKEKARRAKLKG